MRETGGVFPRAENRQGFKDAYARVKEVVIVELEHAAQCDGASNWWLGRRHLVEVAVIAPPSLLVDSGLDLLRSEGILLTVHQFPGGGITWTAPG